MRFLGARSGGVAAGLAAAALGLGVMTPRDAEACGGCFGPPTENASIVTDHRMILSISSQQTTLYDQIRYSGAPSSFAWVLPIADAQAAQLGLSADVVFGSLDAMTSTLIQQPPLNCPSAPSECAVFASAADAGASAPTAGGGSGDVSVTKHEVVGPYVTDYVHSTDPAALNTWLTDHGYAVPADVAPVIAKYVTEHYDFIAMKLVPGQGVDSMRPVRVTTPGASPLLPLRMVAAGTGPIVGITLWVIGEGRYEPNNFKTFSIEASEITWDWTQNRSDFSVLRQQKEIAGLNKLWEIESSLAIQPDAVKQVVRNGGFFAGPGGPGGGGVSAGGDYEPVGDVDGGVSDGGTTDGGTVSQTAEQVREADLTTLFSGITPADTRITRLRADLGRPALATDLSLSASASQAILPNLRIAGKEANQPQCPVYNGCDIVGTAPRDAAIAETAANAKAAGSTFACATAPQRFGSSMATGAVAGLIGLAAIRSRRQRRR